MDGVLIIRCKGCDKQFYVFMSEDLSQDEATTDELEEELKTVKMVAEDKGAEFVDSTGIDYLICSCGNLVSKEELIEMTNVNRA